MPLGLNPAFLASAVRPASIQTRVQLLVGDPLLPFNMQAQTQSNWCWAATATSTSLFYRATSGWTQCKVANGALSLGDCCDSPVPGACNVTWFLDSALSVTGNFVSRTGVSTYDMVKSELEAGRPVGARVGWSGGGGHFMVIHGCTILQILGAGIPLFAIDDPIYGKSWVTVASFSSGGYQGSGTWTHTYFTKAGPIVIRFRLPEISPALLRTIWGARPLLAALEAQRPNVVAAAAEEISFGLPHPIHVIGLRDVVEGGRIGEAPAAIRVLESRGPEISAYYDLSTSEEAPEIQHMSGMANDYGARLERGLEAAIRWLGDRPDEADLKLLRIPAL